MEGTKGGQFREDYPSELKWREGVGVLNASKPGNPQGN